MGELLTVGDARRRLAAIGSFPVGAVESGDVVSPSWGFGWAGSGSQESLVEGLLDLFASCGVLSRASSKRSSRTKGEGLSDSFLFPVLGLDGTQAPEGYIDLDVRLFTSGGGIRSRSTGFKVPWALLLAMPSYWLAPVGPGCIHDNRQWAAINRSSLRELFVGLSELGFSWGDPPETYSILAPLDGFGFADVDFDWMRSEVDARWGEILAGDITWDDAMSRERCRPAVPSGDPFDWAPLGFRRTAAELDALFDGTVGGDVVVERLRPIYPVLSRAQAVGGEDELLAAGERLRSQLAAAVGVHDSTLGSRLRSMPVKLAQASESLREVLSSKSISDMLLGGGSEVETDVWRLTRREVMRLTSRDDLVACHATAPLGGLEVDLSAATELWAIGGESVITSDVFWVGASRRFWI